MFDQEHGVVLNAQVLQGTHQMINLLKEISGNTPKWKNLAMV
jgi:hypothetical protein